MLPTWRFAHTDAIVRRHEAIRVRHTKSVTSEYLRIRPMSTYDPFELQHARTYQFSTNVRQEARWWNCFIFAPTWGFSHSNRLERKVAILLQLIDIQKRRMLRHRSMIFDSGNRSQSLHSALHALHPFRMRNIERQKSTYQRLWKLRMWESVSIKWKRMSIWHLWMQHVPIYHSVRLCIWDEWEPGIEVTVAGVCGRTDCLCYLVYSSPFLNISAMFWSLENSRNCGLKM